MSINITVIKKFITKHAEESAKVNKLAGLLEKADALVKETDADSGIVDVLHTLEAMATSPSGKKTAKKAGAPRTRMPESASRSPAMSEADKTRIDAAWKAGKDYTEISADTGYPYARVYTYIGRAIKAGRIKPRKAQKAVAK